MNTIQRKLFTQTMTYYTFWVKAGRRHAVRGSISSAQSETNEEKSRPPAAGLGAAHAPARTEADRNSTA